MAIYKNTPPIVTNGLVLALDAANPKSYVSGSTIWRNPIPSSPYSCSISGPLQSSTLNGGSVIFSGSTSYGITNYYPLAPSQSASTYEIAFKPIGAISTFTGLLGYTFYQNSGFSLGLFGNQIASQGYSGSTAFYEAPFNVDPNQTNVITVVYGNRTNSYYLNGRFITTTTYNFDVQRTLANPVFVGNQSQGGWGNANQHIFNVKLYDRALTAQEVLQNFNATKGRFGL